MREQTSLQVQANMFRQAGAAESPWRFLILLVMVVVVYQFSTWRLTIMDRTTLTEQLEQRMRQAARHIGGKASGSRRDMAAMERLIYQEMDAMKAQLLQAWVDQAGDDSQRPCCPHCRGPMRQKEQSAKTSQCIGGQVTVERTRWWCDACGASFFPSG